MVQILPLLLFSCVILGGVLSLSGPQFHLENGKVCPPGCCEETEHKEPTMHQAQSGARDTED